MDLQVEKKRKYCVSSKDSERDQKRVCLNKINTDEECDEGERGCQGYYTCQICIKKFGE